VQKFSLTVDQFKILLSENEFRPLASAYCDPAAQCMYHCRFPLVDAKGRVFACNLPASKQVNNVGDSFVPHKPSLPDMCTSCEANQWCKKCPSAVPDFSAIYCPLARIAAERIDADHKEAIKNGFIAVSSPM